MIDGKVIFLCQAIQQLQITADSFRNYPDLNADLRKDTKEGTSRSLAFGFILALKDIHRDEDLNWRIEKLQNQLAHGDPFSPVSLARDLENIRDQLMAAISLQRFAYIPNVESKYFEQDKAFGEAVWEQFPETREEIRNAGNCIAASLGTACIFHLMRTSEYGMRYLAESLGVSEIEGKKPTPIEFAQWGQLVDQINKKLRDIREQPKDEQRAAQLSRYSDIANRCLYIKELWRNDVMHRRKTYSISESQAAFEQICSFMCLLAAEKQGRAQSD